ncbi:phosphoenolpyruvate--protein phosphotransferase [Amaricoccus solimangrovi]|uniref:phosphoenolpyruvate--protein phosphotransferase n=1 Tax=Amaricoccus solimangrovi TaxID=2589815 RepID=A0A501WSN1_9RHOB|nr:phosphoenolpyruvate--protein phosphotransferase [Amaricoccus solimangrovi]TPE48806.1 phosphoenolpyruvate--protein phosphotransferase [Amaricoccus solimangrovi]
MSFSDAVDSRVILTRLRATLAEPGEGQERLDRIVNLIADGLVAEVCSVYLKREDLMLELCATRGLNPAAVHQTRMRVGQGLVGRIAEQAEPINTPNAPGAKGFRFMPETGEEVFSSFLGVPIQRLGEVLGVLVVQNRQAREYTDDEIYALEVVAMVIAEMAELGAFVGPGAMEIARPHKMPFFVRGLVGQEGVAEGVVLLHEPQVLVNNPISDDPARECARLRAAIVGLRAEVDQMLEADYLTATGEHRDVLQAYRMFAHDKGWVRRMEDSIESGLAAEVAVEKEQSATRARMSRVADPYLRERLHDLDDLSNRLLRMLAGVDANNGREIPPNAILVARNIGPGELLDYGRGLRGVVLEEGSVGSHAAIVARALAIPLVIQAARITREALNGDVIMVDGDQGAVHLRPEETVARAFREKIEMRAEAQHAYATLRDKPATSRDGVTLSLHMNAGLMADLPSLPKCGAVGVGLFRTELQFLIRTTVPKRTDLAALYAHILDSAGTKPVIFRTLDIGSDKVLPYMKRGEEPNPALGWRAIRVGLDRPGILRMQVQALLRGSKGRPLHLMFPFVAEYTEFEAARELVLREAARERELGHVPPASLRIGAMLETPSLAYAPDKFFELADFISIGGNDLKQFFFAADRENEKVRRRYDTLSVSFLTFLEEIVARCAAHGTPLSFCGEDAGRPVEALAFAIVGFRNLSMRPASIGPVKALLRQVEIAELRALFDETRAEGHRSFRPALEGWLEERGFQI